MAVVALALTKEAVSPAGTLLTVPCALPSGPVKVSPVRVIVTVVAMESSFSAASARVVAL